MQVKLAVVGRIAGASGRRRRIGSSAGAQSPALDVISGWREFYPTSGNGKPVTLNGRKMPCLHGPRVAPSDKLPDGRTFRDSEDLKQLLLADPDQLARALTTKLLTYATGHPLDSADQPAVRDLLQQIKGKNYGFRSLIHAVVASELFQNK